jgi:large subunit ribosomal protein L13
MAMIIDAKNLIMGRLASFAAKQALKGEEIVIINAELTIITGSKANILERYTQRKERGHPYAGPFFERNEYRALKKTIRGMLPYKQAKGKEAARRVMCYNSIPKEFEGKQTITLKDCNIKNTQNLKYMTLKEVCKHMGKKE